MQIEMVSTRASIPESEESGEAPLQKSLSHVNMHPIQKEIL